MTETSYPFFHEEIQKFDKPDFVTEPQREERRLQSAFGFFTEKIKGFTGAVDSNSLISIGEKVPQKIKKLTELRDSVLFLKLIRIELENEDDAYLIFETLNTRGKDLALTDLLKNHFNKLIKGKGGVDSVKEQWSQILGTLSESSIDIDPDVFFTHSWASRFEAITQQKAYKTIKTEVDVRNAKKHLGDFVLDSSLYLSIFAPEAKWRKHERDVQRSLMAMRVFRISQQTPAVPSLVRAFNSKVIKYSALRRALAAIEDFHFLFTAVTSSRSSGGISAMYSSFGRKLYDATNSNQAGIIIGELIDKLNERKPSLSEFAVGFSQIYYTNTFTKQSQLVRYTLQRIARKTGLAFSDDYADLTIEHILPQSSIDIQHPESLIGSFGNLLLLTSSQNQQLKDDTFEKKRTSYKEWINTIPEDVRVVESWSKDDIDSRTQRLADLAYTEVWKVKV